MKILLLILTIFVCGVGALWADSYHYQKSTVVVNGYSVQVEEALSPLQQKRGLSGRAHLAENQGMLFIFPKESPLTFWMHEMRIPIDMIWLNSACQVVFMQQDVQPCEKAKVCTSYVADGKYVLETRAGFAAQHDVVPDKTVMNWSGCHV